VQQTERNVKQKSKKVKSEAKIVTERKVKQKKDRTEEAYKDKK
jgi:hypothetical protein